jgi:hypothetical protein
VRATNSALRNIPGDDLEVIIVDDASSDGSAERLLKKYAHESRVQLLMLRSNAGPSATRNAGLAAASGELIAFLDSDDKLFAHALACAHSAFLRVPQMQFLTLEGEAISTHANVRHHHIAWDWNPGWSAAGFKKSAMHTLPLDPPGGVDERPLLLTFGDFSEAILFGDLFFLSGVVIRRRAALAAGRFNERYRYYEDWDFMARVCLTGTGGYLDHVGFERETGRADQLSSVGTPWRDAVMHQRVLASVHASGRFDDEHSKHLLRRAQAAADYRLGRRLLEHRHYHLARGYLARALRSGYKPFKTLIWLAGGKPVSALSRYLARPRRPGLLSTLAHRGIRFPYH